MVYRKKEVAAADARAAARMSKTPTATAARYDRRIARIVIDLSSGLSIAFKPQDAQGLEQAKPGQLSKIEISPSGFGLHCANSSHVPSTPPLSHCAPGLLPSHTSASAGYAVKDVIMTKTAASSQRVKRRSLFGMAVMLSPSPPVSPARSLSVMAFTIWLSPFLITSWHRIYRRASCP